MCISGKFFPNRNFPEYLARYMDPISNKTCAQCGEEIEGRVDKKFCSDYCRNSFNNHQYAITSNMIRNVNRILRKNQKILQTLNSDGKSRVSRDKLLKKGFNFSYVTGYYKTKKGDVYFFCYDQGYIQTGKYFYSLVRKESYLE